MYIDMPEQLKKFLKSEVENGNYSNESEVVRDAVRRMKEERHSASLKNLKAELELGFKSIAEGRAVSYTPELFEEIKRKAMIKYKNNIPQKASVIPNE